MRHDASHLFVRIPRAPMPRFGADALSGTGGAPQSRVVLN
eukprot:CAMPEP_0183295800 /NCGR_PEP_ID=MMETSP0160_2-20130417/3622_1 /TAXON_ID=2839 ORGANISM="Odontella Sinensis, Strain Grunow 1884" /NCGR_SAMPLE_ID=MMETSP0160_2 /ASSEMBLY_ACC=CAM_ASM_000250 /LENGTH=39 /DNA_ID= /DNA_START= /DNA_END= /DNA_ORIENTATION=